MTVKKRKFKELNEGQVSTWCAGFRALDRMGLEVDGKFRSFNKKIDLYEYRGLQEGQIFCFSLCVRILSLSGEKEWFVLWISSVILVDFELI